MSFSVQLASPVAPAIRSFECIRKPAAYLCHWRPLSHGVSFTRTLDIELPPKRTCSSICSNRLFHSHASHWQFFMHHRETQQTQLMTKQKQKQRRSSPSAPLMLALETYSAIQYTTFSRYQNKIDLSMFSPLKLSHHQKIKALRYMPISREATLTPAILGRPQTLHGVLAGFIERNDGNIKQIETAPLNLDEEEHDFLLLKGFESNDLRDWARILLLPPRPATQLLTSGKIFPTFLFLTILKRLYLPAICIEQLIWYVWRVLRSAPLDTNARVARPEYLPMHQHDLAGRFMEVSFFTLFIVRLTRHSRRVSLVTLGRVRTLVVEGYGEVFKARSQMTEYPLSLAARMAFVLNRLLVLFSLPVRIAPMVAAVEQEKLQFDILSFMSSHTPSLAISAEGYKALVRVQLAMPKTAEERRWALLKRKAWPPWKEDKTGLDAAITVERGISRAFQIIRYMQEAGYPTEPWMNPATIHAGWDTDGSPTIQTRTLNRSVLGHGSPCDIWTARIRSTRTLNEAWACFLAFEASGTVPQVRVYHAMFERILYSQVPEYGLDAEPNDMVLPGDGKDVFPDPTSPYELTYVSRPPPTASDFLKEMVSVGLRPSGRLLALLFASADSVGFGLDIMEQGDKAQIHTLRSSFALTEPLRSAPKAPSYLVTAYFSLLCKAIDITTPEQWLSLTSNAVWKHEESEDRLDGIVRALLRHKKAYQPAWSLIFKQVLHEGGRTQIPWLHPSDRSQDLPEVSRFRFMQALVHRMEEHGVVIDEYAFRSVCKAAGEAGLASAEYARYDQGLQHLRMEARMFLRMHFQAVVGQVSPKSSPSADVNADTGNGFDAAAQNPRLLCPPQSFILHAYVRALGLLGDYEGLYSFACFIVRHKDQLNTRNTQTQGGAPQKTFREAIVALRVYTQQSWKTQISSSESSPAPELAALIEAKIEGVPEWGGWPSDLEVEAYCKEGFHSKRWKWV